MLSICGVTGEERVHMRPPRAVLELDQIEALGINCP